MAITTPGPARPDGVAVLDSESEVRALTTEWARLHAAAGGGPLTHPDYALSWWRHLGRGRLAVVTVRHAGRLVALAPLHRRRVAGLELVRLLGHGLGTVGQILVHPDAPRAAAQVWPALRQPEWALQLTDHRADDPALLALRRDPAWQAEVRVRDRCPTFDLPESGEPVLPAAARKALRRSQRALTEHGAAVDVELVTDRERLRAVLPDLQRVAATATEARVRVDLLAPPWRAMTVDVLEAFADRAALVAPVVWCDGAAVGVGLALRSHDQLAHWVTAYDPAAAAFSPGHVMVESLVRHAGATGCRRLDLLLGDSAYKRVWTDEGYDTVEVLAAAPGRLAAVARRVRLRENLRAAVASARRRAW